MKTIVTTIHQNRLLDAGYFLKNTWQYYINYDLEYIWLWKKTLHIMNIYCICVPVRDRHTLHASVWVCLKVSQAGNPGILVCCVCADSVRVCVPRHAYFIIKDLWLDMHSMIFSIFTFPGRWTVNDLCAQCTVCCDTMLISIDFMLLFQLCWKSANCFVCFNSLALFFVKIKLLWITKYNNNSRNSISYNSLYINMILLNRWTCHSLNVNFVYIYYILYICIYFF